MPAYVTHTLFSHIALQALIEARHPLSAAAAKHAGLFRVAGIAGCDIQCMPYQVCRQCEAPYRHDQEKSRKCLVCGKEGLEDFKFEISDGRKLTRRDVERDLYGNTHLVLYRAFRGYGVRPRTPAGPAEQPFPKQVVDHVAFTLIDAQRVAGNLVENYLAFVLGWLSHVVSDALFKGVYPHAAKVKFFGMQYAMAMLPAAESLTMSDIAHDWGVNWPAWHEELVRGEHDDGGALRHLAMGDAKEKYGPQWTETHGVPDEKIGRVIEALRPINRHWFRQMYVQADYSAASPRLDKPQTQFREMNLGQLRRYAMGTGWYETFIRGAEIYVRIVAEAAKLAGYDKPVIDKGDVPKPCAAVGFGLWKEIVEGATARSGHLDEKWGSALEIAPEAQAAMVALRGRSVKILLGAMPTDYQKLLAASLRERLNLKDDPQASLQLIIGPPAHNMEATRVLCQEDVIRLKYEKGSCGIVRVKMDEGLTRVLVAGLSDFGDEQIRAWAEALGR